MRNFIYDRGLTAGIEQGIERGRVEAARSLLLEAIRTRGLRLGASQRARVEREVREDVLRGWFRRAFVAERAAELFEDPT